MTDIVDRLRRSSVAIYLAMDEAPAAAVAEALTSAADEIERLRVDLIAANSKWSGDAHTLDAVINEQAADVVRLIAQIDALRAAGDRLADAMPCPWEPSCVDPWWPCTDHTECYKRDAIAAWREVRGGQ